MFGPAITLLCILLPYGHADLHLRQRHDENAALAIHLLEQEKLRSGYNNVTEDPFAEGNEEPIYDKIDMCFGDCDEHSDCDDGLFCFHRDLEDPFVPGCTEEENPGLGTTNSVCIAQLPDDAWKRTEPVKSTRNLLARCRGDVSWQPNALEALENYEGLTLSLVHV